MTSNIILEPILITGCARSGTSMVTGVINMCGAFGGMMAGPNVYNKKGMFENIAIRGGMVKPYLNQIGADPLGQYPLPDTQKLSIPQDWQMSVLSILRQEGYTQGPWMYKCPKMCLMWPVWHYAFPNAKWIIVRRNPEDIVASCMKTGFMTAFRKDIFQKAVGAKTQEEGWTWWVKQHEQRFTEMIEAGLNVKMIWPERMVKGDYSQIYQMLEWLQLPWKSEILSFVDPKLWKSRQKEGKMIGALNG